MQLTPNRKRNSVLGAILCLGLFLLSGSLGAQDVIITKTGEKIDAKILEINDVQIKYREYADPDGIIFTMARGKIREVRYESGRREKEEPARMDEAYYVDDSKSAIKLNFTGIAAATTTLIYEHGLSPATSIEAAIKINGLGFNNDDKKSGFGLSGAYKVKLGSVFKANRGYRPKHFLAGGYLRPALGFNYVNFDDGYYNEYFYVNLGFDIGIQWILQNAVALDMFIGWHYYGGSFDEKFGNGDTGSGGEITDGNLFGGQNSALSIGLNIGGVFGRQGSYDGKKKKKKRR